MSRLLSGLALVFLFGCSAFAQEPTGKPILGKGERKFFADAAGFGGPEQGVTRLEVFALVNARQFAWVREGGQYVAQYDLRYYKDIRHVATKQERKMYERLPDESSKMNFIKKFWLQKNPTPDTPVNERLIQHIQRMTQVETNFTSSNTQTAVESDRGRVYTKYGPPDEIEHTTSASTDKSAEIWHYGQNIFIFRDPNGLGQYRLMHSTYPGEFYNPDWEQQTY